MKYIFTCLRCWCWRIRGFFNADLKLFNQFLFDFPQFHQTHNTFLVLLKPNITFVAIMSLERCELYIFNQWKRYFFLSAHYLRDIHLWCIKRWNFLFMYLLSSLPISKEIQQKTLYNSQSWHALSNQQYFLKHCSVFKGPWVFNYF